MRSSEDEGPTYEKKKDFASLKRRFEEKRYYEEGEKEHMQKHRKVVKQFEEKNLKEKQFAQFSSPNSFFLARETSEEESELFLMTEQKRKEMEKLERQFEEREKIFKRKYDMERKLLQEELKKEGKSDFPKAKRKVEEEIRQIDEEEKRKYNERLKEFNFQKKQKEAKLKTDQKKNKVRGVEVNPKLKQKMKTILADTDGDYEQKITRTTA